MEKIREGPKMGKDTEYLSNTQNFPMIDHEKGQEGKKRSNRGSPSWVAGIFY